MVETARLRRERDRLLAEVERLEREARLDEARRREQGQRRK